MGIQRRRALVNPPPPHHTGVVLAVRGVHEPGGDFVVSAVCFPGLPPNPQPFPHPLPAPAAAKGDAPSASAADKYVALVSGLGLGGSKVDMLKVRRGGKGGGGRPAVARMEE